MTASGGLIRVAAEAGASVLRGKELPAEQVERRRQTALRLNLGRNLAKGCHGPRWTKAQLRMLGRLPDEEVARRTGRTHEGARSKRQALGVANPAGNRWSAAEDALVRTLLPHRRRHSRRPAQRRPGRHRGGSEEDQAGRGVVSR
jgi:hypothetical protein